MIYKFIDPAVVLFILVNIFVAVVFFVGRDAEAATAGTSVTVVIPVSVTAEVPCTPENSSYSEPCMDLDDEVVQVQNVETQSLWSRIVDIFKFW